MQNHTDLCLEAAASFPSHHRGIRQSVHRAGEVKITQIEIRTTAAAQHIGKPKGQYITCELPHFAHNPVNSKAAVGALAGSLKSLLPAGGPVLVLGIGNNDITPDALGPMTADGVLATAHLSESLGFRKVSVLRPGVMAQTGMEVADLAKFSVESIAPSAVIAIDALMAMDAGRLGNTVQMTDTGIAPGSGVGRHGTALNFETLGVPVIGIGIPTVVEVTTLLSSFEKGVKVAFSALTPENLMVTPRDVDCMIRRASLFLANVINLALQDRFSAEELHYLMA